MDIGGQAVIEGVMMRNKEKFAIAVRMPDGTINIKKDKSTPFPKYFQFPFIRGAIGLGYTLYDGIRALVWSSNQALGEDEKLSKREIFTTIGFSFLISIIVFVVVPFFSARYFQTDGALFDLLDGVFRVSIFIGYLVAISYMKDVKKLFAYHGAEHKTIYAYEQKKELNIKNVKIQSRFHPRCGTTFLFLVVLISIGTFILIQGPLWMKLSGRIVLLPAIAAVSYEIIKLAGKHYSNPIMRFIIAPGLWLQRLTTREPNNEQIEVAIASLKAVVQDK